MTPAAISPQAIGIMAALGLLGGLGFFIVVAGIIDYILMAKWGADATMSKGMQRLGRYWPAIPFLVGLVSGLILGLMGGHWWMTMTPLP